jgi:hypothetical protein
MSHGSWVLQNTALLSVSLHKEAWHIKLRSELRRNYPEGTACNGSVNA